MTRTNHNNTNNNHHIERSPSRTSSSSSSAIAQPSSTEPKDIINQNELTIQKLLLELQDDLKQTKECYNDSRDAWLSIQQQQQQKSSASPNENIGAPSLKSNVAQALTNVQNEITMYKTALSKISQVRQLQIEITNVTKTHIDTTRSHTTRRGLADLLSHMAYVLKIWYGSEHTGSCANKVSRERSATSAWAFRDDVMRLATFTSHHTRYGDLLYRMSTRFSRVMFHRHFAVRFPQRPTTSVTWAI